MALCRAKVSIRSELHVRLRLDKARGVSTDRISCRTEQNPNSMAHGTIGSNCRIAILWPLLSHGGVAQTEEPCSCVGCCSGEA